MAEIREKIGAYGKDITEKYEDLQGFFRSRVQSDLREELVLSERFLNQESGEAERFVIRGISELENGELKAASMRPLPGGGRSFDQRGYCNRLLVAATVYPSFKNLQLQRDWGAATAEELLCRMLLAGEYAALLAAVKRLSGFNEGLADLKATAKN